MKPVLEIQDIGKCFGPKRLFSNLSLEVRKGERFFILGPSGCGKTSLLRMIAGLDPVEEGAIRINGRIVAGDGHHVSPFKRGVGFVFQDGALWPHLSIEKHLTYAPGAGARGDWIAFLLRLTGLSDRRKDYPGSLSGGERQRLALARALSCRPSLLLLDEPLRNLDRNLAVVLRKAIIEILEETKTTSIFVTHDQEEALSMAHRILLFGKAGPVQTGAPEELYHQPGNPWAAAFFGPVTRFNVQIEPSGYADTPLGRFPIGLPPATDCELIFRASQLVVRKDGDGLKARVKQRIFQGDRCLLVCQGEGVLLHVLTGWPAPEEGSEVFIGAEAPPMVYRLKARKKE